jgi:molecular chaperone DnaK (HSP70)
VNVGIDLGTTYSLIARQESSGSLILLPDIIDQELYTPSSVYVNQGTAFVGQLAEALAEQQPDTKIIRFFKRHFGENKPIFFERDGTAWHSEGIAALVLRKLRLDAESYTAERIDGAVITVPAHFNDPQRKAVIAAAELAEVPVLDLLEEPVAAALHYGVANASVDEVIAVYDFGGGTFDGTVMSMNSMRVTVLSKDGITDLGGKELDEKIGEMILQRYEQAGMTIDLNSRTLLQLRRLSEDLKVELCMPGQSGIRRMLLLNGAALELTIAREEFEAAIHKMVERTIEVLKRCIHGAGLREADVTKVLLVGGSSMTPMVQRRLREVFSKSHQRVFFHEPTKVVAFGAALRCSQIDGSAKRFNIPEELRGVTGHNIGVRTIDPSTGAVKIDTLIRKNMPLPAKARRTYYTHRAEQSQIILELVQFRDSLDDAISLGQLTFGPFSSPRANYPVDVTVENLESGIVAVSAYDPATKLELSQEFERPGGDPLQYLTSQRRLVRSTIINNF